MNLGGGEAHPHYRSFLSRVSDVTFESASLCSEEVIDIKKSRSGCSHWRSKDAESQDVCVFVHLCSTSKHKCIMYLQKV